MTCANQTVESSLIRNTTQHYLKISTYYYRQKGDCVVTIAIHTSTNHDIRPSMSSNKIPTNGLMDSILQKLSCKPEKTLCHL